MIHQELRTMPASPCRRCCNRTKYFLQGARTGPQTSQQRINAQDASLYPWSTHSLQFVANSNPFPRYGAAFNATASKEGDVYMMGGLIEGSTVKGDLWIIEAGSLPISCYPVPTTSEGPGPRVGHASLLVGNAFIVFGGDTKVDEYDVLDDTLYLLNTCKPSRISVVVYNH